MRDSLKVFARLRVCPVSDVTSVEICLPLQAGQPRPTLIWFIGAIDPTSSVEMTRNHLLAFAPTKSFSFDALDLHHDSVLHDDRDLAELQADKRLANVLDRRLELSRIARSGKWRFRGSFFGHRFAPFLSAAEKHLDHVLGHEHAHSSRRNVHRVAGLQSQLAVSLRAQLDVQPNAEIGGQQEHLGHRTRRVDPLDAGLQAAVLLAGECSISNSCGRT